MLVHLRDIFVSCILIFDFLVRIINLCCTMKCTHEKINILSEKSYCPDCGALVENKWYICRCACCGVKRKAVLLFGNVVPEEKFCTNCGSKEFIVEEVKEINFIDINFATLKKEEVKQPLTVNFAPIQTWITVNCVQNGRLLFGACK